MIGAQLTTKSLRLVAHVPEQLRALIKGPEAPRIREGWNARCFSEAMRLISKVTPTPRLLSTIVPDLREKVPERINMRSRLKSVSLFTGNGRAIFLGLIAGAILICGIGVLYKRHQAIRRQAEE